MPDYRYACTNEECDAREFTAKKSMDEYQDPTPCPKCGTMCERLKTDFCKNFRLKGAGWYSSGYNGASNGGASWAAEQRKAGKDPFK
jgi:predicted nucleic acid-binding Zn ribbon protein